MTPTAKFTKATSRGKRPGVLKPISETRWAALGDIDSCWGAVTNGLGSEVTLLDQKLSSRTVQRIT